MASGCAVLQNAPTHHRQQTASLSVAHRGTNQSRQGLARAFFWTAPHWCGNRSRHEYHEQVGQTQGHEVIGSEFGNGPLNIIKG